MLGVAIAQAQDNTKPLRIGIHAGWTMSRISGDTFDGKARFIGGVHASFPLAGNWYLQPEVNFQQAGGKYKTDAFAIGDILYRDAELNMNYMNVPVLLKYRFYSIDLDVFAGPQAGFKLIASVVLPKYWTAA